MLGVPCENVAVISTASAGLGTICAPSRTRAPPRSSPPRHIWTHKGAHLAPPTPPNILFYLSLTSQVTRVDAGGTHTEFVQRGGGRLGWWWSTLTSEHERKRHLLVSKRPSCVPQVLYSPVALWKICILLKQGSTRSCLSRDKKPCCIQPSIIF